MINDKIFFDEKDPTGINYDTPFTVYGSYNGRLWSKTSAGAVKYYTQTTDTENHNDISGRDAEDAHPTSAITGLDTALGNKEPAFTKNTAFNKDFGSVAGTVTEGNDSRLSDSRTPTAHNHPISEVTNLATELSGKEPTFTKNTGFNRNFGTAANTVIHGNDSRLSNARTPTAHTHGGGDITSAVANATTSANCSRQIIAGTGCTGGGALTANRTINVTYGTAAATACVGNDTRLSNARTPTAHTHPWSAVTSQPATATRWPAWTEVTSKPATFAPIVQTAGTATVGAIKYNANTRATGCLYGGTTAPNATTRLNYIGDFYAYRFYAINNIVAYASDGRLKENVKPIQSALEKIKTLSGFTYNWNSLASELAGFDTSESQVGVNAQDVEKVLPEAVKLAPFDIGENDESKTGENYKTVDYARMVPLLIEAIKEQQKEIDELKSKIN